LEGTARDIVRAVQTARRNAGLAVSDRIELVLSGGEQVVEAFAQHRSLVEGETLASASAHVEEVPVDPAFTPEQEPTIGVRSQGATDEIAQLSDGTGLRIQLTVIP
ncbi:MAG: DUF5915 domain-containing protein, partial [Phycicoccus sp.]